MKRSYIFVASAIAAIAFLAAGGFYLYKQSAEKPPVVVPVETPKPPEIKPADLPFSPANNQIALAITRPQNGATVAAASLVLAGTTVPNADISVNSKDLKADSRGAFSTTLTLDKGENLLFITAVNSEGLSADAELTVIYGSASGALAPAPRLVTFYGTIEALRPETAEFTIQTPNRGLQSVAVGNAKIKFEDLAIGHIVQVKGLWDKSLASIIEVTQIKDYSLPSKNQ